MHTSFANEFLKLISKLMLNDVRDFSLICFIFEKIVVFFKTNMNLVDIIFIHGESLDLLFDIIHFIPHSHY